MEVPSPGLLDQFLRWYSTKDRCSVDIKSRVYWTVRSTESPGCHYTHYTAMACECLERKGKRANLFYAFCVKLNPKNSIFLRITARTCSKLAKTTMKTMYIWKWSTFCDTRRRTLSGMIRHCTFLTAGSIRIDGKRNGIDKWIACLETMMCQSTLPTTCFAWQALVVDHRIDGWSLAVHAVVQGKI